MRIRNNVIFVFIVVFFSFSLLNLVLSKSNREELKGEVVVWSEEQYYDYFIRIANEFEESNRKVNIKVISVGKEEYLDKIINSDKRELPNIVQLDFMQIDKIKEKINFTEENKDIIDKYNQNFNESRLQQVRSNDNYYAVPFESKPIALYIREDILSEYGYETSQLNTWDDLIEIGTEIKDKSSEEFNLFSKEDKKNISLLISSQLVDNEEISYSLNNVLQTINELCNDDYITEDSNYLYRIASLDFYNDIIKGNVIGIWEAKNPPSYNIGENKLYDLGGKNLVALNVDKNRDTIKEFLAFAATNKELLSKELLNNNFFPSSLFSLNIKERDNNKENIKGISPFLLLVNVVERAQSVKNYDRFKEVIYNLY